MIGNFSSGPSDLAPQTTVQGNRQYKYDGSFAKGNHAIRYGAGYTRMYGGGSGFASFFGIGTQGLDAQNAATAYMMSSSYTMPFAGGIGNSLNYPVGYSEGQQSTGALLGNGQGYDTEIANFGFPGGGQFDSRVTAYLGDTWKLSPRLVVNYGLRYTHDTGATMLIYRRSRCLINSDLVWGTAFTSRDQTLARRLASPMTLLGR